MTQRAQSNGLPLAPAGNQWRGHSALPPPFFRPLFPGRRERSPRPLIWAVILAALAAFLLGGCTETPPPQKTELTNTRDGNFTIRNPSKNQASTTGIGCGATKEEATLIAHRVATYNLRGVTGPGAYAVEFAFRRNVPHQEKICIEVEAQVRLKSRN